MVGHGTFNRNYRWGSTIAFSDNRVSYTITRADDHTSSSYWGNTDPNSTLVIFETNTCVASSGNYEDYKAIMLQEEREKYREKIGVFKRHRSYQRFEKPRDVIMPDIEAQQRRKLIMTQRRFQCV